MTELPKQQAAQWCDWRPHLRTTSTPLISHLRAPRRNRVAKIHSPCV